MSGPFTPEQFARLFPVVRPYQRGAYYQAFTGACTEFGITTPKRCAAFFAQVGHESEGLVYLEELGGPAHWRQYEGRADLGNTVPGDGVLFHGRGPIQLTGRANYAEFGQALGLPLESQPELALEIAVGARVAGRFWQTRGCNEHADHDDFAAITRKINGGLNGQDDRVRRWLEAKRILEVA